MNIKIQRRHLSEVDILASLDRLVSRYNLVDHGYDAAAAAGMSDFDSLHWTSLCALLAALRTVPEQEGGQLA
jgi:hypothetical protein